MRESAPSLPTPITLTGRVTSSCEMNSSKRASCAGVSVRVATLKMAAPSDFAVRALACKLRGVGVESKSCRENPRHVSMRQRVQQRMERLGGTQFNIDISNVRQKTRKQFASTGGRQCVRPALGRMTRGGDQGRWQT